MKTGRVSKKEERELVTLGRELAEKACTDESDVARADDVIEWPEESAIHYYPHKEFVTRSGCPRFDVFQKAFVRWVRDTYDADKLANHYGAQRK